MTVSVPPSRIRRLNTRDLREGGKFVVYWMVAQRRTRSNFALEHSVNLARQLDKPLLVVEGLRSDYPWASDRMHRFVLDGMADNAAAFEKAGITYYSYVEPRPGAGKGLIEELGSHASVIVTDDFPAFIIPRMIRSAAGRSKARMEAVDSNGLLPLGATDKVFPTAYAFRRFLQRTLPDYLDEFPKVDPLSRVDLRPARLPAEIRKRWPEEKRLLRNRTRDALQGLPIDHSVEPADTVGGSSAGRAVTDRFLRDRLDGYAEQRNDPDTSCTSGLSPYLHFGHVSSHDVCRKLFKREGWSPADLADKASGSRSGWWGMSESAEGFLDQIVTWRELGYNMCRHRTDYDTFESLPPWALETLGKHARDRREYIYDLDAFESASTHDPIWNAAQRQLVREGRIHNYLRMLWGKKILDWSESPEMALAVMIVLNNKYALDGRNPNSYSGIFWVLGRYDRPWGPERPVFGKVRFMTSQNTARKLKLAGYLERYGDN